MSDEGTEAQVLKVCDAIDDLDGSNDEVIEMLYEIQEHLDERLEKLEAEEVSACLQRDSDEADQASSLEDNFPDGVS